MGVPRLWYWLMTKHEKALKKVKRGDNIESEIHCLYIDSNGLLHGAAQTVFNYGEKRRRLDPYSSLSYQEKITEVYKHYFEELRSVIEMTRPKKLVYIAIDGPAPISKQNQQRERRFVAAKDRGKHCEFNSSAISPGTVFMNNLTVFVNGAIRDEMNTYDDWKHLDVIFSSSRVPGEGEHKIMDYIRAKKHNLENLKHCFFGPDGDLIMLTLATHLQKMYLMRENAFVADEYNIVDVDIFREKLLGEMNKKRGDLPTETNSVINDFILLGFFCGNDFLPKIKMFAYLEGGFATLLPVYKKPLTKNKDILFGNFSLFVEQIAKDEIKFIRDQVLIKHKEKKLIDRTLHDCCDIRFSEDGHKIVNFLDFKKYRKRYYEKMNIKTGAGDKTGENEAINKLCYEYLKGLIWVHQYYALGIEKTQSWDWFYPYHYSPLMVDFSKFLKKFSKQNSEILFPKTKPSCPFVQLLSILPPQSCELLPSKLRRLLKKSKLVDKGYYPMKFDMDFEGCLKEYMGIALLPFVDRKVIKQAYKRRKSNKNMKNYARNTLGSVFCFRYKDGLFESFKNSYFSIDRCRVKRYKI